MLSSNDIDGINQYHYTCMLSINNIDVIKQHHVCSQPIISTINMVNVCMLSIYNILVMKHYERKALDAWSPPCRTRDIKCLISTNSTVAITQYYSIHVCYGQLTCIYDSSEPRYYISHQLIAPLLSTNTNIHICYPVMT